MLGLDKSGIDKLLLQLEERQFIDSRYQFEKENNELKLLGTGGFSYVYEMYDSLDPMKRYAAKVVGLGTKTVDEQLVLETTKLQYFLSEQSENIMRVIALWTMKVNLDESGDVVGIIGVKQEGYDEAPGVLLQIVLMEKLDNILAKDKYGNIELLRDELRTEEGVIRFAENIGRALFTVHNNGFLHRDIKLENIFWDPVLEQYKLGDFGIARFVGDKDAETVVFTDGYGAPEIERKLTESYNLTADIYSFGITLFLLLNGLKFPASDGYHANIVQYSKDFIVPAPANSSEKMAKIIRKMCSYQVKDRYQSVEEILMDIGRLDGSYSDAGFNEYEDLETETYKEPNTLDENKAKDNDEEIPWWEKEENELNREERKMKLKAAKEAYAFSAIWRMLIILIATVLLFNAFTFDEANITRWEFWILPAALIVEAVLQSIKEFHIEFGFVAIILLFFSMFHIGVGVPQIVAIITVLIGIPEITASFFIGTVLWIAQILTGKFEWLDIFSKWDLGWVVLILFAAAIRSMIFLRVSYKKTNNYETKVVLGVIDKTGYVMTIIGIVLLLLGRANLVAIPEIIKSIHLVRTGIGFIIIEYFYLWYYGLLEYKGKDVDEPLDE